MEDERAEPHGICQARTRIRPVLVEILRSAPLEQHSRYAACSLQLEPRQVQNDAVGTAQSAVDAEAERHAAGRPDHRRVVVQLRIEEHLHASSETRLVADKHQ